MERLTILQDDQRRVFDRSDSGQDEPSDYSSGDSVDGPATIDLPYTPVPYTPDSGICSLSEDQADDMARSGTTPNPLGLCDVSVSQNGAVLSSVKRKANALAQDIVIYFSSAQKDAVPHPHNAHARTLRRAVDEVSERHSILLASLVKKLQIGEPGTSCDSFVSVANEMFADKQINWGRVVTLFAFAGWLARYCVENGTDEEWVTEIGAVTGKYVGEQLGPWIVAQGGWEDMDKFFTEEDNVESKIWRGLVYTMLGLGALATTVAAVR